MKNRIVLFANTDWYLYNFRFSLAEKLRDKNWDVVLVSPSGEYGPILKAAGFKWIPFDFSTKSMNPLKELSVIIRLILLYRRLNPAIVHHFTIKCVLYGSIAAYFSGCPGVNSVTGLGHIFTDSGIKARIVRPFVILFYRLILSQDSIRVVFQNESDREWFVRSGIVNKTITHLIRGSGVNSNVFDPSLYHPRNNEIKSITVLFASRMMKEKGVYEVLKAAVTLKPRIPEIRFLFAGEIYPENPSSLTSDDILKLCEYEGVSYIGHQDDMPLVISRCDIVVLPSYSEGTPKILIEAAAMSKPIVATDIPGCNGLVKDGVNGFLVPVRDSLQLAEKIGILAVNPELRDTFGKAGRNIVLREFDDSIVLDKTFKVYRELTLISPKGTLQASEESLNYEKQ